MRFFSFFNPKNTYNFKKILNLMLLSKSMVDRFTKKISSIQVRQSKQIGESNVKKEFDQEIGNQYFQGLEESDSQEGSDGEVGDKDSGGELDGESQESCRETNQRGGLYEPSNNSNGVLEESNQQNNQCQSSQSSIASIKPKLQQPQLPSNIPAPNPTTTPLLTAKTLQQKLRTELNTPQLHYFPNPPPNIQIQPDGKNLPEQYKRIFTQKMQILTQNTSIQEQTQLIRRASKKISVYPYEVKLWMIAYQIIWKVEKFQVECRKEGAYIRNQNKMDIIRRELLAYLLENIHEKKYKVVKILNQVFKVLKMSQSKTKEWLKNFIDENREILQGLDFESYGVNSPQKSQQMNAAKIQKDNSSSNQPNQSKPVRKLKKLRKIKPTIQDSQSQQIIDSFQEINKRLQRAQLALNGHDADSDKNQSDSQQERKQIQQPKNKKIAISRKKKQKQKLKQKQREKQKQKQKEKQRQKQREKQKKEQFKGKQVESKEVAAFPQFFKKNVASRLDEAIWRSVEKVMREKAQEMCLKKENLAEIHKFYGRVSITNNNQQLSRQFSKPTNKISKQKNKNRPLSKQQHQKLREFYKETNPLKKQQKTLIKQSPSHIKPLTTIIPFQNNPEKNISPQKQLQNLQYHLASYLRNHPDYIITDLQRASNTYMQTHSFATKLRHEVRSRWFLYFIKKYKVRVSKAPEQRSGESNMKRNGKN